MHDLLFEHELALKNQDIAARQLVATANAAISNFSGSQNRSKYYSHTHTNTRGAIIIIVVAVVVNLMATTIVAEIVIVDITRDIIFSQMAATMDIPLLHVNFVEFLGILL